MYNLLAADLSAIVDIVALVFVLVFALWGAIRGFTKTFFSVFGTIIGLLLAILLCSSVANFAGILTDILGDKLMNTTLSQATTEYLEEQGVGSLIISIILSSQNESSIPMDTTLNQIICPAFAYYVVAILAAVVLFIIFKIIFFLIGAVVKSWYKNKIIARFDRLLGFALGLLHGVVVLELLIMIISILPISFIQDVYTAIQISKFANFIEDINLYKAIIKTISSANVVNVIKSIVAVV